MISLLATSSCMRSGVSFGQNVRATFELEVFVLQQNNITIKSVNDIGKYCHIYEGRES